MSFDPSVLGLVLLAALLHATWNTIVKTGRDGLLMLALIKTPTMVVGAVVVVAVGLPALDSIAYAIGSACAFTAYCFLLTWAYRVGDLNLVYPVARGSAPLLIALFAGALFGKYLSGIGMVGVLVICAGIAAFAYHREALARNFLDLLRAFGVGLCIAGYTVLDGMGARVSGNVLGYSAIASVFSGIPLIVVTCYLRGKDLSEALRRDWKIGIVGGVLMFVTYAIVLYAMTLVQVTHVAALRETSIIFAALIGAVFLNEPLGRRRVLAASVVALGVCMIALSD